MQTLDRPGGMRIAYDVVGKGPPVLFIQGVGVPGEGWRPQLDGLADRYTCAWFDNRGLGGSSPVTGALTVRDCVEDAVAVLDALGWSKAHIVGHSLGGIIAHQLALDAPNRVRTLSLLCTFTRGKDAARLTFATAWMGVRTRVGTARMRRSAFLAMILSPSERKGADPDALAARYGTWFQRDLADHPDVEMKQVRAMSQHDESHRLTGLSHVPTLIVSASDDPIALPIYGRQLARKITGSWYVEIGGASHGVTMSRPDAINALLDAQFQAG
jgi:pimeloyl-ACP methyl ester carboxylesterase